MHKSIPVARIQEKVALLQSEVDELKGKIDMHDDAATNRLFAIEVLNQLIAEYGGSPLASWLSVSL